MGDVVLFCHGFTQPSQARFQLRAGNAGNEALPQPKYRRQSLLVMHSLAEPGNKKLRGCDPSSIRQQHHKFSGLTPHFANILFWSLPLSLAPTGCTTQSVGVRGKKLR